ncbi:hypothetical protein [Cellulomonas soli]|uniref:Uncharacterized protein n=1 Tax=Cellulomonas soli TaxID=931535 RepID=A0A512PHR7_9CELL|nr:hypothetical protein [Cellulomonas soli]NYI59168.1 hypothetical protein [Cellulomonas soli]GEP70672.1 hypothetical protein CSO01_33870 [Cellulomonas soli]
MGVPAGGWWWSEDEGYTAPERTVTASAEAVLDALYRQAVGVAEPRARARELASLERLLADPAVGMLRRIREARTATIRERVQAGEDTATIARSEGVTTRRIRQLAVERPTVTPAQARAAHRAAMAARKRHTAEARAARIAEAQGWQARIDSGATNRAELAAELGMTRRALADRLRAARAATEGAA